MATVHTYKYGLSYQGVPVPDHPGGRGLPTSGPMKYQVFDMQIWDWVVDSNVPSDGDKLGAPGGSFYVKNRNCFQSTLQGSSNPAPSTPIGLVGSTGHVWVDLSGTSAGKLQHPEANKEGACLSCGNVTWHSANHSSQHCSNCFEAHAYLRVG